MKIKRINWLDILAWWWLARRHPFLAEWVLEGVERETAKIRARLLGTNW